MARTFVPWFLYSLNGLPNIPSIRSLHHKTDDYGDVMEEHSPMAISRAPVAFPSITWFAFSIA